MATQQPPPPEPSKRPDGRSHRNDRPTVMPPGAFARCASLGVNPRTVQSRMRRGWSFEDAVTTPVKHEHAKPRTEP